MANAIDDTASYARVYQTVMTADKRRRSRSVETWTGFPIPRTLLQPIISDGQTCLPVGLKIPQLCRTRYSSMHDTSCFALSTRINMIPHRPCRIRHQNKYDNSPLPARYQALQ